MVWGVLGYVWIVPDLIDTEIAPQPISHLATLYPVQRSTDESDVCTAKSDGVAQPMDLCTQHTKTVSWNCKWSVTLLQAHKENILPCTVNIDSARAITIFSRNLRFFSSKEKTADARMKIFEVSMATAWAKLSIPILNAMTISNITLKTCLIISNSFY